MTIEKSKGLTESEHRLVKLGERVFMGLWSYPNPQIETSSGFKELCDLLVVCGDTVLVFSDKNIKYNEAKAPLVAWQRWERKAVLESINQLHHAENIIRDHPEKIWLNKNQRLPVSIPSKNKLKIHLICVANGATDACKKFFGAGCTGSLKFSNLKDERIIDCKAFLCMSQNNQEEYLADNIFTTCDYDKSKTFVHVFDDYSFPFVLRELDTLTDFVKYLNEKEKFIRKYYVMYTGEEDLLYRYFHNFDLENQCHIFFPKEGEDKQIDLFCFCEEDWDSFKKSREYLSGRRDNKPSYFWDKLVQDSAICALNDTTQIIYQSNPCDKDIALRYMAMEDRLSRRMFSKAMLTSISRCEPDQIRTTAFLSKITPNLMYIFLQVDNLRDKTYTEYIERRRTLLASYINFAKAKCTTENLQIDKFVGIAIEPPKHRRVSGNELVYAEFKDWPESEQKIWETERIKHGVFRRPIREWNHAIEKEWPDSDMPRKIGVNEKCPCGSGKKYKKCCGSVLKQS